MARATRRDRGSSPSSYSNVGNLGFVRFVDEIGRAHAGLLHPHVERSVGLKGKAALGAVELHRGHADIEGDAIDLIDAALGERLDHAREALRHQNQHTVIVGFERTAFGDRIGIAIEGDDPGSRGEDRTGVTAGAEGAVDMGFAGHGREARDHFVEENGYMRGNGGHARAPRLAAI